MSKIQVRLDKKQPLKKKKNDVFGKWNTIMVASHTPSRVLRRNKFLEENDDYKLTDKIIYNKLYPNLKNSLMEEIKKDKSSPRGELPSKLIKLSKAEKSFRMQQIEKIKTENLETTEDGAKKYAILSYVWGKKEKIENILTKGGMKSLAKAIEACKFLDIDYLWMDQLCVNQENREEVAKQISDLGQYYSNATVTLIAIQAKVSMYCEKEKEEVCLLDLLETIINSKWFTRPWTFQEGWLSKRSVFMFDDMLVDGRMIAQFWALHQPLYTSLGKHNNMEKLNKGLVKVATPIGWVYYKDGYTSEDRVFIKLHEALQEVRKRGKNRFVEGIYSILGLLPYGEKVKVKCKERGHVYTEKELNEALLDIIRVTIQEGYSEDFENSDFRKILEKKW